MYKSIVKVVGVVAAVAAFLCIGCGGDNGVGPSLNSELACADGEAWISRYSSSSGSIFYQNGELVDIKKSGDSWYFVPYESQNLKSITWSASGSNIIYHATALDGRTVDVEGTYSISGNTLNLTIEGKSGSFTKQTGIYPSVEGGGPVTPPGTSSYTITFNANGGTVSSTSAKTGADGKLASLPTPTRTGYTFDGWYTAATGGTKVEASKVYTANTTIYARWTSGSVTPPSGSTFTDSRDGKTYKKVVIGTQTWMAENLNYAVEGSKCYGEGGSAYVYNETTDDWDFKTLSASEVQANCAQYGRLYNWATAMDIAASYNITNWNGSDVKHQGACPVGWHIPSDAEWTTLTDYVGSNAGTKLKSSMGWESEKGVPVGTNEYGFSALPGGSGDSGDKFRYAGADGYWWSSTESGTHYDWSRDMTYDEQRVFRKYGVKIGLSSVRCVAD